MRAFLTVLAMIVAGAIGCYCVGIAFNAMQWVLSELAATHLDVTLDHFVMLFILVYALGYGKGNR